MTRGIGVLVVDDHDLFRTSTAMLLGSADGMAVVGEATNGGDAVARTHALRPDVVVMDIRMPGMDGIEATRRIAASTAARVLVLSSFETERYVLASLEAGASGFLSKETRAGELEGAVRCVSSGNAITSARATRVLLQTARQNGAFHPGGSDRFSKLSVREREIAISLARGRSNREIAQELFVSEATVKTHVASALRKTGQRDRVQLAILVHREGYIE